MAISTNFVIDQGSMFESTINVTNADGSTYDLTEMVIASQMRKSFYTSSFIDINAVVDGNPLDGQIKISITPTMSNAIKPGRYVYDVEIHHNTDPDIAQRVLQGIITVSPQVTRA